MGHLPQIITDLALLLIVAAIVTLLFKKIKQPVVLGYILAGILIGPHIPWLPSVVDTENITVWADIGVIFLMFALGLEFSFTKLANVGGSAIVTALTEMVFMIAAGILCATLLGWSLMDSIFLGGMLAISSTTIIIKAFDELNMRGKKFTDLVFGTLVVEDIVGIFLMVLLSTIAVSQNVSGATVALQIGQMALYLALWFVLSIVLVPSILKRVVDFLNDEMLLVIAIGLCLGMVVLANAIGFSSALGAFIAGSILAGTIQAERIEELVNPLKDLFGAVFFVSVGMLVSPAMLVEHIWPIVIITLVTIIGKPIFTALGVLFSGQSLRTAVQCGFSLSQIGEFSFIIAALGLSLGVTADFLYPVIVSVSVVTTLTTPFMIKNAERFYNLLNRLLPEKLREKLNRYTSEDQEKIEQDSLWKIYLKGYFGKLLLFLVISLAVMAIVFRLVRPFLEGYLTTGAGNILSALLIIVVMTPFIANMFYRRKKDRSFTILWFKSKSNRLPLAALTIFMLAVAVGMVALVIYVVADIDALWVVIPALVIIVLISRSEGLMSRFLRLEVHFLANLNERHLVEQENRARQDGERKTKWVDEQLYVVRTVVPADSPLHQKSLSALGYKKFFNANIIKIVRKGRHLNIPGAKEKLHAGDEVYFMGSAGEMAVFRERTDPVKLQLAEEEMQTLHQFIDAQDDNRHDNLLCFVVEVEKGDRLEGKILKNAGIKENYHCFVLGMARDALPLLEPDRNLRLEPGDLVWLLGREQTAAKLAVHDYL